MCYMYIIQCAKMTKMFYLKAKLHERSFLLSTCPCIHLMVCLYAYVIYCMSFVTEQETKYGEMQEANTADSQGDPKSPESSMEPSLVDRLLVADQFITEVLQLFEELRQIINKDNAK